MSDTRKKILDEYQAEMYAKLHKAVIEILDSSKAPKGCNPLDLTASWIAILTDMAFEISEISGLEPKEFSESLRAMALMYENMYTGETLPSLPLPFPKTTGKSN